MLSILFLISVALSAAAFPPFSSAFPALAFASLPVCSCWTSSSLFPSECFAPATVPLPITFILPHFAQIIRSWTAVQ